MPLVPGVLITNAVRDLMAGHFISGMAKVAEAFLTAFAIGLILLLTLSVFKETKKWNISFSCFFSFFATACFECNF